MSLLVANWSLVSMPEVTRINISPLFDILSRDMDLYSELFEELQNLEWKFYGNAEMVMRMNKIRVALGLKPKQFRSEAEFAESVGECQRLVLKETKKIRNEVAELIKRISTEEFSFGKGSFG